MALSHLRRPKSSLQMCRISLAAARRRCCTSVCFSSENDNPAFVKKFFGRGGSEVKQKRPLDTESGLFSKATFIRNGVSADGGSNKRKTLTDLFREQKNEQAGTMTKGEVEKTEETLSDVCFSITKYRSTQFELLSQSNDLVPSGPIANSEDDHSKEFPPNKCKNNPPEHENVRAEGGDMSSSVQSVSNSEDNCMESANDHLTEKNAKRRSQPFAHSKEPRKENKQNYYDILSLINVMRLQVDLQSNTTNDSRNGGPVRGNSVNDNMQRFDDDDKLNSPVIPDKLNSPVIPAVNSNNEEKETSILDFRYNDRTDSEARIEVSVPKTNKDQKQLKDTVFAREENKVIVWFLPSEVTEKSLIKHFSNCGEVLKVELPSAAGPLYKTGYVYFKTREGHHNALKRSVMFCNRVSLIVESALSTEKITLKIHVPCLIGDPDIPAALVKNPSRTVKIEQLTHEMSSHLIEKALSFCGSNISGYFLGASHSVAYVEFETEIGKERALAKQSINVLGKDLVILRVDAPRTTVVRISNIQSLPLKKIHSIYKPLGDALGCIQRTPDIIDVHFGPSDWPNMLKIINRLNGCEVEGKQLQAEPAPVYPPEVLLALWHRPEERKHLKAIADSLLHKLGDKDTLRLVSIENSLFD